jgi:cellulose synthase/poly-beta-1,6-N-acetylglucosamine synthase-like glycosyltransferase
LPEPNNTKPSVLPSFSVIIPARNEEKNISNLLLGLQQQDYPAESFEVIVVDDHSSDNTAREVQGFAGVRLLALETDGNSNKKKAIEWGIAAARNEWIVCTDADCIPGPGWLSSIAAVIKKDKSAFVAAPVSMEEGNNALSMFQSMDFMILQAITGAATGNGRMSMCNGANIAYRKEAFRKVNGFEGIDHIASGDDMLLMYKIWKQYPHGTCYIKSPAAIVRTAPMGSWKEFFSQRIRWASKARNYQDKRILPVLILVYLFNLSFLVLLVLSIINVAYLPWLLGMLIGKFLVELPLFLLASKFFRKKAGAHMFLLFQPMHILYTIISGSFSQFGKYEWKGRRVK